MRRTSLLALSMLSIAASVLVHPLQALAAADSTDLFTRSLQRYGWAAALPAALLVGLATAATPCVYPMIAITVSVFGARNEKSRGRAMALSTAFVLGIAAMFVPLGLIAGLSGSVAGAIAGNRWVQLFEAGLMFAMAASMFGAFEITLPGSVQNRLAAIGGLGIRGAFLIGLATGPIAAPCATAGLVGILDYVFTSQNAVSGGLALFAYSVGLGLPFWLVGTFAVGLPKPGRWMDYVKNALGLVLVVVGLRYLRKLLPFVESAPQFVPAVRIVAITMVVLGVLVGAVHLSIKEGTPTERVRKVVGMALTCFGALWFIGYEPPAHNGPCAPITWERDPIAALARGHREGRPVVFDWGATWCPACEELAHQTFPSPTVACAASELNFIPVKIYDDEQRPDSYDALHTRYAIRGLPTVIVIDANGREVGRETRFVPPDQMAALLRRVDARQSAR